MLKSGGQDAKNQVFLAFSRLYMCLTIPKIPIAKDEKMIYTVFM
jgi:hypothetical protein